MTSPPSYAERVRVLVWMWTKHIDYLESHWPRDLKLAGWLALCSVPAWLNLWDELHHPSYLWWVLYLASGLMLVGAAAALVHLAFRCRSLARQARRSLAAFVQEYPL